MPPTLPPDLCSLIAPFCVTLDSPGPGSFQALRLEGVSVLANYLAGSAAKAMAFCLEYDIWPLRFARNRGVFQAQEQRTLLESRAAIFGCGGLGGHVVTLLAGAGVGAFTLCDFDVFDESNLNRQLLCQETDLGKNKALVAQEKLSAVASHADVRVVPVLADQGNLPAILADASLAVDCLDSLTARYQVAAAADAAGLAFIHGAVAGYEGFAMVIRPGEGSLNLLYSSAKQPANTSSSGSGAEASLGVPTVTPATIAALQTSLAIQVLIGKETTSGRLYHLDMVGPMLEVLAL